MSLIVLPDLKFPVTSKQADSLMVDVVQLNLVDAGINERQQKALDIMLDTYELKAKSGGKIDYTSGEGHRLLFEHAMTFVGDGSPVTTRHGDLRAAHLAIAFNNAQMKLKAAGMPALTHEVALLLELCKDFAVSPLRTEEKMGVYLSYLQKRSTQ
jgi:hypothetical protein